jgi:hypothetical protein
LTCLEKKWKGNLAKWASGTGQCLQEMIYDNRSKRIPSCPRLEDFAFDSHPICYKENDICNLSWNERISIFNIVEVMDLLTGKYLRQALNVLISCAEKDNQKVSPYRKTTFMQLLKKCKNGKDVDRQLAAEIYELCLNSKNSEEMFKAAFLELNDLDALKTDSYVKLLPKIESSAPYQDCKRNSFEDCLEIDRLHIPEIKDFDQKSNNRSLKDVLEKLKKFKQAKEYL